MLKVKPSFLRRHLLPARRVWPIGRLVVSPVVENSPVKIGVGSASGTRSRGHRKQIRLLCRSLSSEPISQQRKGKIRLIPGVGTSPIGLSTSHRRLSNSWRCSSVSKYLGKPAEDNLMMQLSKPPHCLVSLDEIIASGCVWIGRHNVCSP